MNNKSAVKVFKEKETVIDTEKENLALKKMKKWLDKTFAFRKNIVGEVKLDIGYFANLIDIGSNIGLALSTDGVGTKILVAQMMNKYDTVGIDCIAMNVNDIICLGAEPLALLDYIAVEIPDENLMEEIAKGLYEGSKIAKITIPGGETAQIGEIVKGTRKGYGFDLAGTCVGIVPVNKAIIGQNIDKEDVIVGLRSSGIHSNGLTLARKALFKNCKLSVDEYIPECKRTLGEELLEPTHIYVPEIMEMLNSGMNIKALVNITSDGFLNLTRVSKPVSFIIENLPEPQPIFNLIQRCGNITDEEMFYVFNMGIGFCVVLPSEDADKAIKIAKKYNVEGFKIGYIVEDNERSVDIKPKRLIGKEKNFLRY
jgi:phosphoribosylformylglycinamidine cyclo-ligase